MYKYLLCWRYLRTRYIALASIVSVTLGVATMIVVNSVMAGFNREMQDRIHGILSDIVFESYSLSGFQDPAIPHGRDSPRRRRRHRRDDAHDHRAGNAQLSGSRRNDHAASQSDRHRSADPRPGQRLLPVLATSGKSRGVEFQPAGRGLRRPRSSGRPGRHLASRDGDCRLETPPVASRSAKGDRAQHGPARRAGRADPFGSSRISPGRPGPSDRWAGRGPGGRRSRDGARRNRRGGATGRRRGGGRCRRGEARSGQGHFRALRRARKSIRSRA